MDNFAFIIHPINPKRDVERKFPLLGKYLPVSAINFLSRLWPPVYISHIEGIKSQATNKEIEGWFVACPFTPQVMMSLSHHEVYRKIIKTGQLAQKHGAKILGLGAFTSVVGDGGITIAKYLDIPVTNGNSYTIAIAVEAIKKAAEVMNIELSQATVAIVGATGSIGKVCAQLLARDVGKILLLGRRKNALNDVQLVIAQNSTAQVQISTSLEDLQNADLIIAVSSAVESIIQAHHLKSGAVVCDVARPRDVSRHVVEKRQDVLVIEGGMVEVPGDVKFNFNFGFPEKMAYACMSETMILAMEQRYESFSLGKDISLERVQEIARLAKKHGFKLGGFRSFEKPVTQDYIDKIKSNI
ncbi:MAG: shikimate dehydrogenase [Anaerolineaceae bacterium 4572_78]|nr:MAG: shikimate dehydrogenase [Anaerolineaceae bacterium 4572_78]